MPKMFPDVEKSRVIFASRAEEYFYNQSKATLSDGWRVYSSITLSVVEKEHGLQDNEIDFVCYHPQFGVVVVEVKGGRIHYDADRNQFASVNRHGEKFFIKDPFQQALVWKSRLIRLLRRKNMRLPISHAVCFPSVKSNEIPPTAGVEPTIIIGRDEMKNLDTALKTIVKKTQPEKYLEFKDAAVELDKILVGATFTSKLFLKDYIDSAEFRVRDVETINETLMMPIASSDELGIEGEAGTGKTMLALLLAKHFRDQGRSVLFLSSNGLLNLQLRRDVGEGVDVMAYFELGSSYGVNLLIPPKDYEGTKNDWIQYEAPERLKKAIEAGSKKYEVLICDEAQDVQPFWWDAIEGLRDKKAEESKYYVFFDRSQGVFGSGGDAKFEAEESLPIDPPFFPLVHNYRTTREIATFSRAFRTGKAVLKSHCGRIGYLPELIIYKDAEDAKRQLGGLFRKLFRDEGLSTDEVTLLSARNPEAKGTILHKTDEIARVQLHTLAFDKKVNWRERLYPQGKVAVSTIARFKGMETSIGVLMNVSEYNLPISNAIMSSMIYVACTRAKHMLYIMVQEDDPKRKAFEKAIKSIKSTGSLVLEGSVADFEFSGTVRHYNPSRIGWLSVEDPGFSKADIMFFPHDVKKAKLEKLKVGTKIVFRPRVEGRATIACDLRIAHDQDG